jgi:hypothetical protein
VITINFHIDKVNLAYYAIQAWVAPDGSKTFIRGQEIRDRLNTFRELALKEDAVACRFLGATRLYEMMTFANHENMVLSALCQRAEALINNLLQQPAFLAIFDDTKLALENYRSEWLADYDKSFEVIKDLTGLNLNRSFEVYVTHPCQPQGINEGDTIYHTYRTGFPHYNTVYMWHEVMHSLIKPVPGRDQTEANNASHAVIELLTDNELRCRFSGASYPPFEGHDFLDATREYLLPSWREYLASSKHDILDYLKLATQLEGKRIAQKDGGK